MLDEKLTDWLRGLLARHGAVAGTIHVVHGDALAIAAAVNIPPKVQELTATIPMGKGMAGLAWQHDKPIQTCNLKDDASGAVQPGARAVDARGAVAMPVHDGAGMVHAVVGLAWADERELDKDALATLGKDAEALPMLEEG
jgi:L-methionine (R)-S-oxide reductase